MVEEVARVRDQTYIRNDETGEIRLVKKRERILEPNTHYSLNIAKMRTEEPHKVQCSDGDGQKTCVEKKVKTKKGAKQWGKIVETCTILNRYSNDSIAT